MGCALSKAMQHHVAGRKVWIGAIVVCCLAGCATPYQKDKGGMMSFGGYSDWPAPEADHYYVENRINQFTSVDAGNQQIRKRSQAVCAEHGFRDYVIVSEEKGLADYPNFRRLRWKVRCLN